MDSAEAICQQQKDLEEEHPKKQPAGLDLSEELLDMPSDEEMETGKLPSSESSKDATSAKGQGDRKQSTKAATCSARSANIPERDCTYTAINKFRSADRVAPNLMGGELLNTGHCGELYSIGDERHILCFTKFDFGKKQSIMFSFNHKSMECHCCQDKVLPRRISASRALPRTFVLSDQNFPSCLPATSGRDLQCLKIIRLEFASLWELCSTLTDLVRKEDLLMPMGSAVLIGSASHLSKVGISAYCEELVAVSKRLQFHFNGSVYVLPCPFILSTGSSDPELVRAYTELVSWLTNILGKEVSFTPVAMDLSARRILCSASPTANSPTRRMLLPVSMSCNLKKVWACGASNLPTEAEAAGVEGEKEIVSTLIRELNARLASNLDPDVSYERTAISPCNKPEKFVVVGASHAGRTADALVRTGAIVFKVVVPGWRIMKQTVAKMSDDLKLVLEEAGEDCTVVFQLFDANYYLAKSDEGGLLPIRKLVTGDYHVEGELSFAPKELQYSIFCTAKPLLEVAGGRRLILLTPLPRYLLSSCCSNPDHVSNMKEDSYRKDQELAVFECKKNVKDFCFRHGIRNVRVSSPWTAVKEIGDDVWFDSVHLTKEGYTATAELLLRVASELASKPEADAPPYHKRAREDGEERGGGRSWGQPGPHSYWSASRRGRR